MTQLTSPGVSAAITDTDVWPPRPKDMSHDGQYLDLVRYALENGDRKPNRTGIDTIGVFGYQMRFNLRDGTIPLLTTKKMFTRGIIHEILWYLRGESNINYLTENNVHIWDEWAKEDGSIGPVYGVQWRNWKKFTPRTLRVADQEIEMPGDWTVSTIDQIAVLVDKLKNNPNDRRMIVSAWNVADLADMGLPPCHYTFQCYAKPLTSAKRARLYFERTGDNPDDVMSSDHIDQIFDMALVPRYELSMILNQRSCDVALGVPFNIVQYSIMLRMLAHVANMTPGEFIWNGGDVHIYENHVDGLNTQLEREPMPAPTFRFARDVTDIDDFKFEDFVIEGYTSHPTIKFDVAV